MCVLQDTAPGGIGVSSGVCEREKKRGRATDKQEERKRRRERETRVSDAGKGIEGHVQGSREEKERV